MFIFGAGNAGIGYMAVAGYLFFILFQDFANSGEDHPIGMLLSRALILGPLAGILFSALLAKVIQWVGKRLGTGTARMKFSGIWNITRRCMAPLAAAGLLIALEVSVTDGNIFLNSGGGPITFLFLFFYLALLGLFLFRLQLAEKIAFDWKPAHRWWVSGIGLILSLGATFLFFVLVTS